mmetsp:Transcript_9571/g.29810  ORF Transcript_9571/g.29810 Transcript_9571/m.29810 type:complete len:211 (-) Transcript_9571:358-990(-)
MSDVVRPPTRGGVVRAHQRPKAAGEPPGRAPALLRRDDAALLLVGFEIARRRFVVAAPRRALDVRQRGLVEAPDDEGSVGHAAPNGRVDAVAHERPLRLAGGSRQRRRGLDAEGRAVVPRDELGPPAPRDIFGDARHALAAVRREVDVDPHAAGLERFDQARHVVLRERALRRARGRRADDPAAERRRVDFRVRVFDVQTERKAAERFAA